MAYFTDDEAKRIWKARWAGTAVQELSNRYRQNPFRLYEVWTEKRNFGTRLEAFEELKVENPQLASRTDPSPHVERRKVVPRSSPTDQFELFES